MYGGKGADLTAIVSSGTVVGAGAILLPSTGDNTLGLILAYSAISLGVIALLSQISVRLIRRFGK
jgi:hypothetical protein